MWQSIKCENCGDTWKIHIPGQTRYRMLPAVEMLCEDCEDAAKYMRAFITGEQRKARASHFLV